MLTLKEVKAAFELQGGAVPLAYFQKVPGDLFVLRGII